MRTVRRGMMNIRTMGALRTQTPNTQRKYLRLALLALQNDCRIRQREAVKRRLEVVEEQIALAEAESQKLLAEVAPAGAQEPVAPARDALSEEPPEHERSRGFRIRY
jgi:hypothetical protein